MKQGPSTSKPGNQKVEPRSTAINPAAVSEIGVHQIRTRSESLYAGKGYKAPLASTSTHPKGSQGKR